VSIKNWLNEKLENIFPIVEVSGISKTKFDQDSFNKLISKLLEEFNLTIKRKYKEKNEYILSTTGKEISIKINNSCTMLKIFLNKDGNVEIVSYLNIIDTNKSKNELWIKLKYRLDVILKFIDHGVKDDLLKIPDNYCSDIKFPEPTVLLKSQRFLWGCIPMFILFFTIDVISYGEILDALKIYGFISILSGLITMIIPYKSKFDCFLTGMASFSIIVMLLYYY
jgi:hypothetical protein